MRKYIIALGISLPVVNTADSLIKLAYPEGLSISFRIIGFIAGVLLYITSKYVGTIIDAKLKELEEK